jgi:bilirubin oxidase
MSDNRNFQQIGADDALLNSPLSRNRMVMAPGERIEAVLDLSDAEGKTIYLMNYAGEWGDHIVPNHVADDYDRATYPLLALHVVAATANPVKSLSTTLNNIPAVDASKAVVTRTLLLNVPPSINGGTFEMDTINYTATVGTQEIWSFFNASDETHPMHLHDTPFRVISRNGKPPEAYEAGWKDTIMVRSGDTVQVLKDFPDYPDPDSPYVYHCHILEHEDHGMMGQYVIVAAKATYLPVIRR